MKKMNNKKLSRIVFGVSWFLLCLTILFLDILIRMNFETKTIILCLTMYLIIISCVYTISCIIGQVSEAEKQKQKYERLLEKISIKNFVYEDTETDSLYINREDVPEIIEYLYELQITGGLVHEEKDNS